MKINNILQLVEAPLPDDWDKEVYSDPDNFEGMIGYAKERAEAVGVGSSRVAFVINYQGRKTVLKIAKNTRGLYQNNEEAKLLSSSDILHHNSAIPMIDYDTENPQPTWIHTEYADPITVEELSRYMGHSFHDIIRHIMGVMSPGNNPRQDLPDDVYENEYFDDFYTMVTNAVIDVSDLFSEANWGEYQGRPVIIDLGYHGEVIDIYKYGQFSSY